jgi:protein-disulfide isomerase
MRKVSLPVLLAIVLSVTTVDRSALAETDDVNALRREIEALKQEQTVIRKELQELKSLLGAREGGPVRKVQGVVLQLAEAPAKGEAGAKVTVVEFTDYQCPFCAKFHAETRLQIERDYVATGKVRYLVRNLPIASLHKQAFKAAEASGCAREQGKFWEMHDRLFANQSALGPTDLRVHAEGLGLEPEKFQRCLDSGRQGAAIRRDLAEGQNAGVRGTPAFFLGLTEPSESQLRPTTMIVGAQPYAVFRKAIDSVLEMEK